MNEDRVKESKNSNIIYYEDLAENDLVESPIISEDSLDISDNKLENKTFQLQELINHLEYRIRGYSLKNNGTQFEFKGNVLLGVDSINEIATLLQPFSREVNMIGDKKAIKWAFQNFKTRGDFNRILLKNHDVPVSKIPTLWRTFSNLFDNIGDIIVNKNSQEVLNNFFGLNKEEKVEKIMSGEFK